MIDQPLQIYIGYDSKEPVAYHVLAHSILRRASRPVSIVPLALSMLGHVYTRPRGALETTEFSLSRFLVPYLSCYEGFSLFLDCDMLCQEDIFDVFMHVAADPYKAVYCCQHDYIPRQEAKFLGQPQTAYPRKNWSSFMIFDNARCLALTPEYVNTATGLQLHRFQWVNDAAIGSIALDWNWLVGEYSQRPDGSYAHMFGETRVVYEPPWEPKMLHYTLGGPWFDDTARCDHSEEWRTEFDSLVGEGRLAPLSLS